MPIEVVIGSILLLTGIGIALYKIIRIIQNKRSIRIFYRSILKELNAFYILINEDLVVLKTNYYLLRKEEVDPKIPKRVGELMRCRNGLDVLQCGGHVLCQFCPIRANIVRAFEDNGSFRDIEAPLQTYTNDEKNEYTNEFIRISGNLITIKKKKYMLLTIHNVTNFKETQFKLDEEKQHAQQSDRLKTAFLSNMSHEIRTPLNAITGFANLLNTATSDEERQEYIDQVNINTDLLLQMINDIFDFSKLESDENQFVYTEVNVNHMFSAVRYRFDNYEFTSKKIQIVYKIPDSDELIIHTDYERVSQVLTHLLSNAIKFTSMGLITLGYEVHKDQLYCFVQDTGPGLSQEEQEVVFDRFTKLRSNKPGSGLGLAICKIIIQKMHGRIGVFSSPGEGSTFWFTLPLIHEEGVN